jgi:DNA-directed RNA polymerase III subunit RPC4
MVADEKLSSHRNPQDDQKEWKGVYDDDTDKVANIISEPGLSPPQTFKNPLTTIQSPSELPPASQPSEIPKEQKVRRHSHSKRKDKKPIIQTEEDRAEYARHLHDMAVLRHELGGLQTNTDEGSEQPQNVEGDAETEEPVQENTHGRLYLFQFPPVLPKLYNPLTSTNPNITAKPSDKKSSIDLTKSTTSETSKNPNSKVKAEPEAIIIKKEDDLEASNEHEKEKFVNEEGYIGKLIVRESGKVELSWGGTNMVMGRGASAGFLSAGVVVDGMGLWGDDRGNSNANGEGKAMAMGEIMGKFVVVPNWERLA